MGRASAETRSKASACLWQAKVKSGRLKEEGAERGEVGGGVLVGTMEAGAFCSVLGVATMRRSTGWKGLPQWARVSMVRRAWHWR